MITINKGEANTVIVTLTEKSTLTNPHYLFEFRGDNDKAYYYCIAADTSAYPYRYNQFSITEKNNPNPLNGEISLPQTGYYHYTIYEQASATNLDPANATDVVETGKAKVIGTENEPIVYESNTPQTNIIYQGS